MASTLVFYMFVGVIIFSQGIVQSMGSNERESFHKYIIKDCKDRNKRTPTIALAIGTTAVMNSTVGLRDTNVSLIPEPGYEFKPRTVFVKRCDGHCECGSTPESISTRRIPFSAEMHLKGNHSVDLKCGVVYVTEHTKCKCTCTEGKPKTLQSIIVVFFYVLGMFRYLIPCKDCHEKNYEKPHVFAISDCPSNRGENGGRIDIPEYEEIQPLKRYIPLIKEPGFRYDKSSILVNQCAGSCIPGMKLVALKTTKKFFNVDRYHMGNPQNLQCGGIEVDEHTDCACRCPPVRDCTTGDSWNEVTKTCGCDR